MILTIIIPFHNRHHLLDALLHSIPDDTRIEILLVNDNSETPYRSSRLFKFSRISVLNLSPVSRYAGAARNLGIKYASNKFIAFADSDDLFDTEQLLSSISYLECSSADIIFTHLRSFVHEKNSICCLERSRAFSYNLILSMYLLRQNHAMLARHVVPYGKFISRDYIQDNCISFDEIRYSNDICFSARLLLFSPKVELISRLPYLVRQGNVSLTSIKTLDSIGIRLEALLRFNSILKSLKAPFFMAPALPHIISMLFLSPLTAIRFIFKFALAKQPIIANPFAIKIAIYKIIETLIP
jgi:glycosyltransferase involved in cell wall biosynthesis